jgi:hypothetical protein
LVDSAQGFGLGLFSWICPPPLPTYHAAPREGVSGMTPSAHPMESSR